MKGLLLSGFGFGVASSFTWLATVGVFSTRQISSFVAVSQRLLHELTRFSDRFWLLGLAVSSAF